MKRNKKRKKRYRNKRKLVQQQRTTWFDLPAEIADYIVSTKFLHNSDYFSCLLVSKLFIPPISKCELEIRRHATWFDLPAEIADYIVSTKFLRNSDYFSCLLVSKLFIPSISKRELSIRRWPPITFKIPRYGNLLEGMYVRYELPAIGDQNLQIPPFPEELVVLESTQPTIT